MATPVSEVIARNTSVLDRVDAFLTKAEDTSSKPSQTQTEPTDDKTDDENKTDDADDKKDDVTRDEFDALMNRVAELENQIKEKDEQNAKLVNALEASTNVLKRFDAFFATPSNRAILADGEPVKATVEAGEVKAQKTVAEQWLAMPKGKASEAFYRDHEAEIINSL